MNQKLAWLFPLRTLILAMTLGITALLTTTVAAQAATYYVSPTGDDQADGTSPQTAFATFDRSWQALYPGDTLIVMDGVYRESLRPDTRNGTPGKPITIRAQNDGKAIVDGEYERIPVQLGDTWPGPIGDYFVIEGIVARNSSEDVVIIKGNNNTLRRFSAYNANADENTSIITVAWTENIVLEDCLVAGTGRKMILLFTSSDITVRRCYAQWERWDGQTWCGSGWPAGNGIHVYSSSHILIENSIATGPVGDRLIGITNQSDTAVISDVRILGSVAVGAGMNSDGTVHQHPLKQPNNCNYAYPPKFYDGERSGFVAYGQGKIDRPIYRDILAVGNAHQGFASIKPFGIGVVNGTLDHATIYDNAKDTTSKPAILDGFTVTNSDIEGTEYDGQGARLDNRYVDGQLTDEALWPWPMQARAQEELDVDVTGFVQRLLSGSGASSFRLATTPSFQAMRSGETVKVKVTVQPQGNFDETVTLTASTTSEELRIEPASVEVAAPGEAEFTLRYTGGTVPAAGVFYGAAIDAVGGEINRSQAITILVNGELIFLPRLSR